MALKKITRESFLLLEVNPTESASMWSEYCEKLRKRGVNQVYLFVADALPGFGTAVAKFFPSFSIKNTLIGDSEENNPKR